MSTLKVEVKTGKNTATLVRDYQRSLSSKYSAVQALAALIQSILSGNEAGGPPSVTVAVKESEVAASGTFTLDTVIATDAVSINGVSFTCVAENAEGNQFDVGADDDETATNLAAAINASASALVSDHVSAEASAAVVTVTAKKRGVTGNANTIASADSTITASGARLENGADDSAEKSYTF